MICTRGHVTNRFLSPATDVQSLPVEHIPAKCIDGNNSVFDNLSLRPRGPANVSAVRFGARKSEPTDLAMNFYINVEPNPCAQSFLLHPSYSVTPQYSHCERIVRRVLLHVDGMPMAGM